RLSVRSLETVGESGAEVMVRGALGDHAFRGLVKELARFEAADDQPVARHVVPGEEADAHEDQPGIGRVVARVQRVRGSPGPLAVARPFKPPALEYAEVDAQVGLPAEIGVQVLARADEEIDRHAAEAAVPLEVQADGSPRLDVALAER